VSVINAPAGSGKTRVLAGAARIWAGAGLGPVIGITPSQSARNTLAAGVPVSYNAARFLGHLPGRRGGRGAVPVGPGTLLVIDEALMLSGPDLAGLIAYAQARGVKIILAGDVSQLPAVENGGGMSLLAGALGYARLAEPVRFGHRWEQQASLRLRNGDTAVLAEYDQHARIAGGDPEQMTDAAAAAYVALTAGGTDTLLMAAGHALRRELSRRIRDDLIRLGRVQNGPGVTIAGGTRAGPGDLILCTRNAHDVEAANPAAPWSTATCSASRPSPRTGCSSAAPGTPTRPPGSGAGPPGPSATPATRTPNPATRSPTTRPRAAPCTPAWR
jgi:ATP-dependent exoDNAse (exonuclease V) alpha subunit